MLRAVAHEQGHHDSDDEDQQRDDHERLAPAGGGHEQREQRDDEVAAPTAGGDDAHRPRPLALEPVHHGRVDRHAHPEALAQRGDNARRVVGGQRVRLREEQQAAREQHDARQDHLPRAEPIDEHPADRREQALLEAAQREPERDRRDAPAQLLLHRLDQHAQTERGDPEGDQIERAAAGRDVPAVEHRAGRP